MTQHGTISAERDLGADLESEIARVSKLVSLAQHTAAAAAFMGIKPDATIALKAVRRRDALIIKLRAACIAHAEGSGDDRARCLADLRAETE